jgi:hypothetical protein
MYCKLQPNRDLQCYFEKPSAIAALSEATPNSFVLSGTWRQQFDWAVVEWNRDNVIEHPLVRNLPDGDLSGVVLSYCETRSGCIAMDSDLFPTVDWPYLRIWADDNGTETFYRVRLRDFAVPVEGEYAPAHVDFELVGTVTTGDYVGLSVLEEHFTHQVTASDTAESVVQAIVDAVNSFSSTLIASRTSRTIRLYFVGPNRSFESSTVGANGNRYGAYGFVSGAKTESWFPPAAGFHGGTSPTKWRVSIDFGNLIDVDGRTVPTRNVRKMRWTYAADLQRASFERCEFVVTVTDWNVSGERLEYKVAGPGSVRLEDNSAQLVFSGSWEESQGNFSGGTIRHSTIPGSSVKCSYRCSEPHQVFLGSRYSFNSGSFTYSIDGGPASARGLFVAGEDVLCRIPLGELPAGEHTVVVTHNGPNGSYVYIDFIEVVVPSDELPILEPSSRLTLATDWDTDHSIAIAPERTAWLIDTLGFKSRQNHYVGALWFYELTCVGNSYASVTLEFVGTPEFSQITEVRLGYVGSAEEIVVRHLNRIGDTPATIAKAFECEFNRGYTGIWAEAFGERLVIHSRVLGAAGNAMLISATPQSGAFRVEVSGNAFHGGVDGVWRTDAAAFPRINRACRDWSRSFYRELKAAGIEVTAAFSMELQHGDDSVSAGIAQRYPDGTAAWLNTPALQTNFSPSSRAFWRQVYLEMATIMVDAGVEPYLQFGEVQWWYFPKRGVGMPFYDEYTTTRFELEYGRAMQVISSEWDDPSAFAEEMEYLPRLIGEFTLSVMTFVREVYPQARFEVLYPTDVNETPLNQVINYPSDYWTPSQLDCLKTESFTFTFARDVDKARGTINYPATRGFPISKRSFLVGINDPTTPWERELEIAQGEGNPSNVLFALDQFCLVGYPVPVRAGLRRSVQQG